MANTNKPTNVKLTYDSKYDNAILTFDWSSTAENYEAIWFYIDNNGISYVETTESWDAVNGDPAAKHKAHSVPSEAVVVYVRVRVNITDEWNSDWTESNKIYPKTSAIPVAPSAPSVSVDKNKKLLVISLTDIDDDTDYIKFTVYRDAYSVAATGGPFYVSAIQSVSWSPPFSYLSNLLGSDGIYTVKAKAFKSNGLSSEYSQASSEIKGIPSTPLLDSLKAYATSAEVNPTAIEVKWKWTNSIAYADDDEITSSVAAEKYIIQHTTAPEYFEKNIEANITSVEIDEYVTSGAMSTILSGLDSGAEYYVRVAAANSNFQSDYSNIKSLILGADPAAPTTWSSVTSMNVGDDVKLYWVHNPADGSSQKKAKVVFSFKNSSYEEVLELKNTSNPEHIDDTSCLTINTSTGQYTYFDNTETFKILTADVLALGGDLKWYVTTSGVTGNYGDESVQRQIDIYAASEYSVISNSFNEVSGIPSLELPSYPIDISIRTVVTDEQKPLSYYVQIIANESYSAMDSMNQYRYIPEGQSVFASFYDDSGANVESSGATIYQKDISILAGDADLETSIKYTLAVSTFMDSSLTETKNIEFRVNWEDSIYNVGANFFLDKNTLSMSIKPFCTDSEGNYPDDVSISIYRRNYDSSFTLISSNISNNQSEFAIDPHPQLNSASYRIVAISNSNGGSSYMDYYDIDVGEKAVVIQWDESWKNFYDDPDNIKYVELPYAGTMLKLPYNIDISSSNSPDVSTVEYVGRQHPVAYYGTQLGESASWSVNIPKTDADTLAKIRELMTYMGDVYVREPSGTGFWANIKVSYNLNHCELAIPVSFEITRVEGGI